VDTVLHVGLKRKEEKHVSMRLENPKRFLPLLLFIGFVFVLMSFAVPSMGTTGIVIMALAITLWILVNRRRMGFR
jgi:membrane-bound ClpP family serine protease